MPAPPLTWKKGEGSDIHLLRKAFESKRLIDALDIDPAQTSQITFIPNILGHNTQHGIQLDVATGVLRADAHPDPTFPEITNFLLTVTWADGSGASDQTEIRVHIHDSIKEIWLTPPTLTIHKGIDECRFTVYARFNDDCVGDITDWPQSLFTYQSADESVAKALPGGILQAVATSGSAPITVRLSIPSLGIDKTSRPAQALASPSWADLGKDAKVSFVAGRRKPDETKPTGPDVDSVESVVGSSRNVLFIAEGFQFDQRFDYRNIVNTITRVMRGEEAAYAPAFEPFGMLKNAINYWTVFVPSKDNGITSLGEYFYGTDRRLVAALFRPQSRPSDTATEWNLFELIHETSVPIQSESTRTVSELVADWKLIFGDHVTEDRVRETVTRNWKTISHAPLNERDTVFGIAGGLRPNAMVSLPEVVELDRNSRRSSVASIQEFIKNLRFGGFPIGPTWATGGKDVGLICMICLTDRTGGTEVPKNGFFAAATGQQQFRLNVKVAADSGLEIETSIVKTTPRHLMASVVAHELGHALSLGDEYGDEAGGAIPNPSADIPPHPNLQSRIVVAPPPAAGASVAFTSSKIKWLWPRIAAAGVLAKKPVTADVTATGISIALGKGHGLNFAVNDVVRFKEFPVSVDASFDFMKPFLFKVTARTPDGVTIIPVTPTAGSNAVTASTIDTALFLQLFDGNEKVSLIKPIRNAGVEVPLVASVIQTRIDTSDSSLDRAPASPCIATTASIVTPTNLPTLSKRPSIKADIIGLYEGGFVFDCGVFRPAGRCRMRDQNIITTPYCFVCRYILVDNIDPSQHGLLNKLYPEVSS